MLRNKYQLTLIVVSFLACKPSRQNEPISSQIDTSDLVLEQLEYASGTRLSITFQGSSQLGLAGFPKSTADDAAANASKGKRSEKIEKTVVSERQAFKDRIARPEGEQVTEVSTDATPPFENPTAIFHEASEFEGDAEKIAEQIASDIKTSSAGEGEVNLGQLGASISAVVSSLGQKIRYSLVTLGNTIGFRADDIPLAGEAAEVKIAKINEDLWKKRPEFANAAELEARTKIVVNTMAWKRWVNSIDFTRKGDVVLQRRSLLPSVTRRSQIRFSTEDSLGQGNYGTVRLVNVTETLSGKILGKDKIAVKVFPSNAKGSKLSSTESMEIALANMKKVSEHPSFIKPFGGGKDSKGNAVLFMEKIDDSLWANLNKIDKDTLPYVFLDVADGIKFLNGKRLAHNDLKPENIGIVYQDVGSQKIPRGKIIDLDGLTSTAFKTKDPKPVTRPFAAPEVILSAHNPSPKSDVYSLGMTIIEARMQRDVVAIVQDSFAFKKSKNREEKAKQNEEFANAVRKYLETNKPFPEWEIVYKAINPVHRLRSSIDEVIDEMNALYFPSK